MVTLANTLTILLLVIDIARGTFGMGTLLVIPVIVSMVALTREKCFYHVGGASVVLGLTYKEAMFIMMDNIVQADVVRINQITTVVILAAYLLLYVTTYVLLMAKQCKTEGTIEVLQKKYEVYSSAALTTYYIWALIMIIYIGCNSAFKQKELCVMGVLTLIELCVAFGVVEALLRKAVNDEKAKRREQDANRVEMSGGNTN